jgi:cytochrome o ubiquinol oxidase subunit IV
MKVQVTHRTNPQGINESSHAARANYLPGLLYPTILTLAAFLRRRPSSSMLQASRSCRPCWPSHRWASTWCSADQTNNFLALAFGIFIAGLIVFGSMIIMAHPNHAMMPIDRLMQM